MKQQSWVVFFLILTASCLDEPDCYQLHNDVLGVTFRVMGTGQGDSVLIKNFSGPGKDATIVSFNAELNYFQEEDSLIFQIANETDFLTFSYAVKNQFISEECGSSFVLSDLKILGHSFDSARVINSNPTKTGAPNIEIYRCPETDTITIDFNQLLATTNGITVTNPDSDYISHAFDSITNPEALVFSGQAATVKLPVNLLENQTTFVFKTDDSKDTLVISYDRTTEHRYNPCGVQTFVTDLVIEDHTFDSVSFALKNFEPMRSLLDPQESNIRVYDCPPTNLLQANFVSAPNSPTTVTIDSVKGDHFVGKLFETPVSTSSLILPVDPETNISTFYIYYNRRIETLSVQYAFSTLTFFDACPDPIITLTATQPASNFRIISNSLTLKYPAVANVEITVQ